MLSRDPFTTYSPYEESHRKRRQVLTHNLTLAITYASPLILVPYGYLAITMPKWQSIVPVVLGFGLLMLSILGREMNKKGRSESTAIMMGLYLLVMAGVDALLIKGLIPGAAAAYILVVIIAGMVLGANGSLYTAFVATIFLVILQWLSSSGLVQSLTMDEPIIQLIVTLFQVSALFFTAILSRLSTQDLQRALDDATYDLVQANKQLEQASQLKSQFMARTSHELRTPLNSIIGFTDLSLREIYGPMNEMQIDGFRRVLSNAKRLLALINDILDLSKIEAGELVLFEDEVSMQNLLNTVNLTFQPLAKAKNLRFSLVISEEMPHRIIGDENRLTQIMTNLVDNAIKYTDAGSVTVEVGPQGLHQWRIRVEDTGRGIREDDFDAIFEEFRQVGNPTKQDEIKGTGLGLSITRHLAQLMGGEIIVTSRLGQGSSFDVTLPLNTPMPVKEKQVITYGEDRKQ